mgnify:CR=1 FL=1|jgi:hypothetical protein
MQRGVLQLTREEVLALYQAFHWDSNGHSIVASKLQYAYENLMDINDIFVSEDDLDLLLDDIAPVDSNNTILQNAFNKIGDSLRQLRGIH